MKIRDILRQATREQPYSWLFLSGDYKHWTLDTEALLVDYKIVPIDPETEKPVIPPELISKGFRETIDSQTIADCIQWADRLSNSNDEAVRFESLVYYIRFDAFLPRIGAPDPPPPQEAIQSADLKFYEMLGPEDSTRPCKREGCSRGAIRNSVFCRRHHFEMIKRRVCPFD